MVINLKKYIIIDYESILTKFSLFLDNMYLFAFFLWFQESLPDNTITDADKGNSNHGKIRRPIY